MLIRRYQSDDWQEWLRMSRALFPGASVADDEGEMRAWLARTDAAVIVVDRGAGGALGGFVEVGSRPYADGCATSPVGYVEAWYVDRDVRRQGYGRALLDAAEDWARAQGYSEMASDALLDNVVSHQAHRRSGYTEVDRVIQYRKEIGVSRHDDRTG